MELAPNWIGDGAWIVCDPGYSSTSLTGQTAVNVPGVRLYVVTSEHNVTPLGYSALETMKVTEAEPPVPSR